MTIDPDGTLSNPRRWDLAAFGLGCAAALLYAVNFRALMVGDSMAHLFQAASLAWTGDLTLDEWRGKLIALGGGRLPYYVMEGSGGHLRSLFNYFPSVVLTPFFWMARLVIGSSFRDNVNQWALVGKFAASMLTLGAGTFFWLLLRRRIRPQVALMALAGLWLGSPLWATSVDYLQHQPQIFFKLAALYAIFGDGHSERRPRFFIGGLLLALAVISRYQTGLTAFVIAVIVCCAWRRDRKGLVFFVAGGMLPVAPTLLYHWLAFGYLDQHQNIMYLRWDYPFLKTLMKLLVNPSKGMLIHSPWLIAAIAAPAVARSRAGRDPLAWVVLLAPIPTVIMYAKLNQWFGGWSWGYRFMMDVLPEAALAAALGMDLIWARRPLRWLTRLSVAAAIAVQAIGALGYDGQWHAIHDLGIGPYQNWLWQGRNSQIAFTARRGLIYIGAKPVQLWPDPYRNEGLYGGESWGDARVVWTRDRARFYFLARQQPVNLRLFPNAAANAAQPLGVSIEVQGAPAVRQSLAPGRWNEIPLPSVGFQYGAVIGISVDRTFPESAAPNARRLGVALSGDQLARPEDLNN